MKTTFSELKLKKGDTVFIYGNWNGFEKPVIQYYVQMYIVHSIGMKRCYLLYPGNKWNRNPRNKKTEYSSNWLMNMALTREQATEYCEQLIKKEIAEQIKGTERSLLRETERLPFSMHRNASIAYIENRKKDLQNLLNAPTEIRQDPYNFRGPVQVI